MDFYNLEEEGNIFPWNLLFFMDFSSLEEEDNILPWNLPIFMDFSNTENGGITFLCILRICHSNQMA